MQQKDVELFEETKENFQVERGFTKWHKEGE